MNQLLAAKVIFWVALTVSSPALASVVVWTGADDNDWFGFQNWDTLEVPDGDSETRIPGPATVQITDSGAMSDSLSVGLGTEDPAVLTISGNGQLILNNPGRISSTGNSPSRIEVSGPQAGFLSSTGSGLAVGQFSQGELEVDGGANLLFGSLSVGNFEDAQGAVFVRDQNSAMNIQGLLQVGRLGSGTMTVTDGGLVLSESGSVGSGDTGFGDVIIRGEGASWFLTGAMLIGGFGTGTLTLGDRGLLSIDDEGSPGLVDIGARAPSAEGTLRIGEGGAAGRIIASQIRASQGTATVIFDHDESVLDFIADGTPIALTEQTGTLSLHHVGTGTTRISADHNFTGPTSITAGRLIINGESDSPVSITGDGTLSGRGTINGDVDIAGGTLAPGDINWPRALKVTGDVTFQEGSTLAHRIDIFGDEQLEAGGIVTFDDTSILVEILESDHYFVGQRFTVIQASQIIGTPQILIDPDVLIEFDVIQTSEALELVITGFRDELFFDRFQS
jgi:T5SS/PEP-CTERM-associated repeat protein/autotransporter-associated beta strand protein